MMSAVRPQREVAMGYSMRDTVKGTKGPRVVKDKELIPEQNHLMKEINEVLFPKYLQVKKKFGYS